MKVKEKGFEKKNLRLVLVVNNTNGGLCCIRHTVTFYRRLVAVCILDTEHFTICHLK